GGDAGGGGNRERVAPFGPGTIGLGGVTGARAELDRRSRGSIDAPAQATPSRGGGGIVHRRFVRPARAGRFPKPEDLAEIAGGGEHGVIAGQQADSFAFVGLRDQRNPPVGGEAVDAAVLICGEENLFFEREEVVNVFVFRTPERLDGVVRVDAIDGALFDPAGFRDRRQRRGDLWRRRGCRGRLCGRRLRRI